MAKELLKLRMKYGLSLNDVAEIFSKLTHLPSGTFHLIPHLRQLRLYLIAVVALNLNHPVFDRAAGATQLFQLLRQGCNFILIGRYAGNHRHCFAAAMLAITHDAHNAIALFGRLAPTPTPAPTSN